MSNEPINVVALGVSVGPVAHQTVFAERALVHRHGFTLEYRTTPDGETARGAFSFGVPCWSAVDNLGTAYRPVGTASHSWSDEPPPLREVHFRGPIVPGTRWLDVHLEAEQGSVATIHVPLSDGGGEAGDRSPRPIVPPTLDAGAERETPD